MKEIDGKARSISEVLKGKRYTIDYYQREYRWQRKQVQELIDDLTEQFLESYEPNDQRRDVADYGHYFLGSIILSERDGKLFIVDGQQRLTTVTLLLILLHREQGERADRVRLEELIYSEKFGERDFNIAVPERTAIMEALFRGELPDTSNAPESVQTIVSRYQDLQGFLPEDIDGKALPFFCDWLTEKVHLVEISAANDEDAYTIFETMNDRGLSLSPLDMLKGLLLAKISDTNKRNEAARVWRERVEALRRLGKDEDTDAFKAWLRARHAVTLRERKTGSENKDFERIGSEFHRWVGEHASDLRLESSDDYFRFVYSDMTFYTLQYERLRKASQQPMSGLEDVYHVACFNFTLQYPLLLAPLLATDNADTLEQKIRAVAVFLDILLARRAVNYLRSSFGDMSYWSFNTIREIRGKPLPQLVPWLINELEKQGCDFDGTKDERRNGFASFGLNQWSKRYIKVLLARMTAHLERASGLDTSAAKYLIEGRSRFEIEHIWADHPEKHADEFASPADFENHRNRFGDLLLLPKSINASYGDLPYREKREHYIKENLLASSLHEKCYERHPQFLAFIQREQLPFKPCAEFRKSDLDERHALYRALADRVWNPQRLAIEAGLQM